MRLVHVRELRLKFSWDKVEEGAMWELQQNQKQKGRARYSNYMHFGILQCCVFLNSALLLCYFLKCLFVENVTKTG